MKKVCVLFFLAVFCMQSAAHGDRFLRPKLRGECLPLILSGRHGDLPESCEFEIRGRRIHRVVLKMAAERALPYDFVTANGRKRKLSEPYSLFRGQVKGTGRRASGSASPSGFRITYLNRRGLPEQVSISRSSYEARLNSGATVQPAKLERAPGWRTLPCGIHSVAQAAAMHGGEEPPTLPASSMELEVALTADKTLLQQKGSASAVASYLDATVFDVNEIYARDLDMDVTLRNLTVLDVAAGMTGGDAETLLEQFTYVYGPTDSTPRDVAHLVTGKQLEGEVIGLAWLGVVCVDPAFAYSLSEDLSPLFLTIIMAHEIGHNLGADHHDAPQSLMSSIVSSDNLAFSTFSQGEIFSFIGQFDNFGVSNCLLSTAGGGPTPTPSPIPDLSVTFGAKFKKNGAKQALRLRVTAAGDLQCSGGTYEVSIYGSPNPSSLDPASILEKGVFLAKFTGLVSDVKQVKSAVIPLMNEPKNEYFSAFIACSGSSSGFVSPPKKAVTREGGKLANAKKLLKKAAKKFAAAAAS